MNPKAKRLYYPRFRVFLFVTLACVAVVFSTRMVVWGTRIGKETGLSPKTVVQLLFDSGVTLKQFEDRTNILLLGVGGGVHEGADLTDTIIVLSVNIPKRTMALISVPRDIWSDTLKDKVNSAYHYGQEKKKGGGIVLAKAIMEDVVGLPIHYGLVVDFSGFEDIINLVGGVDVVVPAAFTDDTFPIAGKEEDECGGDPTFACRYETVHFDEGIQHMDGGRALTYVRSRHAEGDEGSDFARSRRQQDVLVALKKKLVSPSVWMSPSRAKALFAAVDKATDTDMTIGELATMGKLATRISQDQIQRISLEPLLTTPPSWWYGRYVLVPQEDFASIHSFIRSKLQ